MKKFVASVLALLFIFSLCGCGGTKDEIILMQEIDELAGNDNITQENIDKLFEKYNSLSSKEKEKVTNYNILKKYEGVHIDKVKELQDDISDINDTSRFSDIIIIHDEYESLNSNEKQLIDISIIQDKMELTDLEKAVISACQYVKNSLKSSSSFKLQSAKAIDDIDKKSNYYLVDIKYSATNSFGASIDDTSFQTISEDFENPWYPLAMLNGDYSSALKCTPFLEFYLLNDQEPTEIDCDKIIYYIDTEVR